MYPKDTSSEDPGPAHKSEGGGVQTETSGSGMRRSMFPNPSSSPSSSNSSPTMPQSSDNPSNNLNITVAPFTGGPFEVKVSKMDTVDELKKVIARRLKVSKERIYLLYRESELVDGSVQTNLLVDGSTVTLLPRAETGLISPKPEQSVMQALESLNEQQVNDFLSGAAPLNLTMRLGDHMMLIQLQLSTVNQASSSSSRRKSTIQISSSSPPPYPTPPPSAPSSPTFDPTASSTPAPSSSSSSSSKKVRVPLLSPGGLYTAPTPAPARASSHSSHSQTIHRNLNPSQQPEQTQSRKSLSGSRAASSESGEPPAKKAKLDTKALAEASKNLTQTLKQLSSEVLTTRTDQEPAAASSSSSSAASSSTSSSSSSSSQIPKKQEQTSSKSSSGSSSHSGSSREERRHSRKRHSGRGAIIESMHHHGKGVYSGTFSGTLNPALQDENGQPKRDITTIVHILNDLLCAQYKAYGGSSSGSSRSSKHHHHRERRSAHHHHHHHHTQQETKSTLFEAEARAATERQRQEEQLNLTRHKVETLRKVMEERKAKREARRQAAAARGSTPTSGSGCYSTAWSVSEAKPESSCDKEEESDQPSQQPADHFLTPEPEPVTA